MTPSDVPCPPPEFSVMTSQDILAFFDRYKFRDDLGHSLTLNQDFIDLVEFVKSQVTP